MPRLSGSMQPMTLARENNHHGRALQKFEGPEHLLAAGVRWRQVIVFTFNEHYRSMNLFNEGDRRSRGVTLWILKRGRLEPHRLEPGKVCRVPPRFPVGKVSGRHCCGQTVSVSNDPIDEHSAGAATSDAELIGIDVAALENFIDAQLQVLNVVAGKAILNDVSEFLSITPRATRIDIQNDIAGRCHQLKFVSERPSPRAVRPTMYL